MKGITANVERARRLLDESTALVTALNPHIGYARSSEIAQEALHETADGRMLWVLHGDRFDGVIACAKWLAHGCGQ